MGADLMDVAMDSEKVQANDIEKPVTLDICETDKEADLLWDFYIQTLDKKDQAKAYEEVTNMLPKFFKFQKMTVTSVTAKRELEHFRKLEYEKLAEEEKGQIISLQAFRKSGKSAVNTVKYEELTDDQKNLIYLSPEYFCNSQITDKLVYIYSYRNFPPVRRNVNKYGYICWKSGKCEIADIEQTVNEAILSVLEDWKQKENQKTQREAFKNAVQNKIKRNLQVLLEKMFPGFTSDWRHYVIKKTIEDIEQKEFIKYCSCDKEDILIELTATVNSQLGHEKGYTLKAIKTVLKEREQCFSEVSLEQQLDAMGDRRLSGINYDQADFLESPEELTINQIEYESVINSIQNVKDRNIVKLTEYGYRSEEIGKIEGLSGAAVRQRLKRLRQKLTGSTAGRNQ